MFDEFVRVVERQPATTFIGVHFGNDAEDPEEVSRLLGRLPNLYIDTAARVPEAFGRRAEAARVAGHPDPSGPGPVRNGPAVDSRGGTYRPSSSGPGPRSPSA